MRTALLSIAFTLTTTSAILAQNPIPNQGFENWGSFSGGLSTSYMEPSSWNTANQCSQQLGTYSVARSADAHSGSFSAELKTRNAFLGAIKINGVMTTAQILCAVNSGGQEGGLATSFLPDSIVFWYKYSPGGVDTAYTQVILFSGADTVSFMKGKIHQAATEWTRASFAIPTPTSTPDLISTFFNSSWGDGAASQAVVNSTLLVDDVEYVIVTGIEEDRIAAAWSVFPNPVQEVLNIRNESGATGVIEVTDAMGRMVMTHMVSQLQTRLDVGTLPAGVYLYQVRDVKGVMIKTGKLLRSH